MALHATNLSSSVISMLMRDLGTGKYYEDTGLTLQPTIPVGFHLYWRVRSMYVYALKGLSRVRACTSCRALTRVL